MKDFDFESLIKHEALNILCAKKLGRGLHRTVFELNFDKTKVVKIANDEAGARVNIEEYNTWCDVRFDNKINSYFAEAHEMSEHGIILIQEFIPDLPKGIYKIPSFFSDVKQENFGLVVGKKSSQIVCRDYGLHLLRQQGSALRLKKYDTEKEDY